MAELKRGFKSKAERCALAVRQELGLSARDRLEPQVLAAHLGVPVVSVTQLRNDVKKASSIGRILSGSAGFSAATVCAGDRRLIVFNPDHPPGRRANSLVHELSHVLLEHKPQSAFGIGGCRNWNAEQEAEADWQAAALLVPREGALWWMRRNGDIGLGAQHFGVSEALFRWRVNQTGVVRQLQAARNRRTSFSDSVSEGIRQVSKRYGRQPLLAEERKSGSPGASAGRAPLDTSGSRKGQRGTEPGRS